MSFFRNLAAAALVALPFAVSNQAQALELEPEEFVTAPAGTTAFLGYAIYANHDRLAPVSGPSLDDGTNLDLNLGIARLAHYFNVGDTLALVEVLQPFGSLNKARVAGQKLNSSSGLADTIVAAAIWPINDTRNRTYVGLTLYTTLPTGKYDKERAVNLGGNRFVWDPQIALSKGIGKNWSVDLTADLIFYSHNDKAGINGAQLLTQSETVQMQAFLNHKFANGFTLSAGYQGMRGGKQKLDGIDNGNRTHFDEARLVASKFVTSKFQLMGEVNHQFNVRGGFRQDIGLLIRGLYIF
ncbi:transporter [Sphingobium sp.]|uniref:transporter n=1 Tax=Sphingobium sp. TaxID=1912891 RepID=UPI0028BDB8D6|nr:transporter [Sphingobium sp.]